MDLISGLVGGASMIANMFGQSSANDANREIARETNRANMAMFRQNLDYNDPKSQKARLKAAGLNSDLMYQNGASGLVNANVPQMQQSAPMQNVAAALDPLTAAQIANINADTEQKKAQTENTNADTTSKLTYNQFQPMLLNNEVKLGETNIDLNSSKTKLTDAQEREVYQNITESNQRVEESKSRIDQIRATISNLDEQTKKAKVEAAWADKMCQAQYNKLVASAHLDSVTANVANQTLPYLIAGMQADAKMKESIANLNDQQKQNLGVAMIGLGLENELKSVGIDQAKFNLKSDQKYKNDERAAGVVVQGSVAVKNTAEAASSVVRAFKPFG